MDDTSEESTTATIEVATWFFSFRVDGKVPNYRGTERPVYGSKAGGWTRAEAQERARQLVARLTDLDPDRLTLEEKPLPENEMARMLDSEATKENT